MDVNETIFRYLEWIKLGQDIVKRQTTALHISNFSVVNHSVFYLSTLCVYFTLCAYSKEQYM
jgi:hypothetical protein